METRRVKLQSYAEKPRIFKHEIQKLFEVGFEYVCEKNDRLYFRKRE